VAVTTKPNETRTAMSLLGDDGRGYELARKLESAGTWRTWLGDSNYTNFAPFLSSPSAWNSFMSTDSSKSTLHIHLQLRVRALLFDKASSSISLSSNPNHKPSLSKLNPNFLRLYPDDVYFTLDNSNAPPSSSNSKVNFLFLFLIISIIEWIINLIYEIVSSLIVFESQINL
jgi:hypothetical protein